MAKFELSVYDSENGNLIKTVQRNFMPVGLYIRFQQLSEKLLKEEVKDDGVMFAELKPLFCEVFHDLTEAEYEQNLDIAEVLILFRDILYKSTKIEGGNSKKA